MLTFQNYVKPESLEAAWELYQKKSAVLLGGMQWLKMSRRQVQTAIDISGLGLDQIEENKDSFSIGCMVSLRQLELHHGLEIYTSGAMREALRHIVGVQFRNTATVGGSVAGRFGFSDVITILLALDARVECYKAGMMPIQDYISGKRDRDILVRIVIDKKPCGCFYQSVRNTQTDFPVLTCAAVRSAAGWRFAIGARPKMAMLITDDGQLQEPVIEEAWARAFAERIKKRVPTESNLRGSAEYRTHLAGVLVYRAIRKLEGEQPWNWNSF